MSGMKSFVRILAFDCVRWHYGQRQGCESVLYMFTLCGVVYSALKRRRITRKECCSSVCRYIVARERVYSVEIVSSVTKCGEMRAEKESEIERIEMKSKYFAIDCVELRRREKRVRRE